MTRRRGSHPRPGLHMVPVWRRRHASCPTAAAMTAMTAMTAAALWQCAARRVDALPRRSPPTLRQTGPLTCHAAAAPMRTSPPRRPRAPEIHCQMSRNVRDSTVKRTNARRRKFRTARKRRFEPSMLSKHRRSRQRRRRNLWINRSFSSADRSSRRNSALI